MRRTDRWAKTIVFCVDQRHALEMRKALTNLNKDLVAEHPDFVERVTSDEGDIGRGHLSNFQEPERSTPVILTSSQDAHYRRRPARTWRMSCASPG
jgi:type I restriction enzyme R subunit